MSERRPKNGPDCAPWVSNEPKTNNGLYLGLRGSKPNCEGTNSTRNPPLFAVSKPQIPPTRRLGPRTSSHLAPVPMVTWWSRRAAQPVHGGGQRWIHQGPGAKKNIFSKLVPRPLGMLKQVFLAHFETVVMCFGPWRIPKCLENGLFWGTKNGSKMGQKGVFPKVILDHLGCSNKCFSPILSPLGRVLAHGESQNALKGGHFGTKNGSKIGQKRAFRIVILDHSGCSNKCF